MKALTIRQPWASLVALGVKTIETRSWSTSYRGPLAIHAGKARVPTFWHHRVDDDLPPAVDLVAMSSCWQWTEHDDFFSGGDYRWVGPLGAVVAVVDLLDVVPMIDGHDLSGAPRKWTGDGWLRLTNYDLRRERELLLMRGDAPAPGNANVTDQLPFGDFAPGRFAWLLGDVRPLDPPIPAKGKQGLWTWEDPR